MSAPESRVRVVNRCPQEGGKTDEAIGEARLMGAAGSPRLEVRFAPAWLSWLPLVWGNYWVVDLDPAYQVSVVSEPKREYLWVLSRTPTVEPAVWDALMARLREKGFDLSRLTLAAARRRHTPGRKERSPRRSGLVSPCRGCHFAEATERRVP